MSTPHAMVSIPRGMVELAHRHAAAEAAGDIEATLATLEPDPTYGFYPAGRGFTGMAPARRYYRHFFDAALPRIAGYTLHGEWLGAGGLAQEYTLRLREADGALSEHRIVGIITFGRTALGGERIYASERLLRFLVGPLWDELERL